MTGAAIVDASVALKWFVAEADSDVALRFLSREMEFSAPTLLLTELANALWRKWRHGLIPPDLFDSALDLAPKYFARLVPTETLLPTAARLSRTLDHPIYDCCYLALAIQEDAALATADRRLLDLVVKTPHAERVLPLSAW